MQFTTIIFALLPVLVTAHPQGPVQTPLPSQTPNPVALIPFSDELCVLNARRICPKSNDGQKRCLEINDGPPLCTFACEKESTCPAQCKKQGHQFGWCTTGDNPCICSNVDGADDAPTPTNIP